MKEAWKMCPYCYPCFHSFFLLHIVNVVSLHTISFIVCISRHKKFHHFLLPPPKVPSSETIFIPFFISKIVYFKRTKNSWHFITIIYSLKKLHLFGNSTFITMTTHDHLILLYFFKIHAWDGLAAIPNMVKHYIHFDIRFHWVVTYFLCIHGWLIHKFVIKDCAVFIEKMFEVNIGWSLGTVDWEFKIFSMLDNIWSRSKTCFCLFSNMDNSHSICVFIF